MIHHVDGTSTTNVGGTVSALSKSPGRRQFCHRYLKAIICRLLQNGVPEEPPSREKDSVLAA